MMKLVETPEEFAEWCVHHGHSKEELARILGVTRQTLYNLTHPKARTPAEIAASDEIKLELAKLSRLPPMLSLSLFAIENLGTNFFGQSQQSRKVARRSK